MSRIVSEWVAFSALEDLNRYTTNLEKNGAEVITVAPHPIRETIKGSHQFLVTARYPDAPEADTSAMTLAETAAGSHTRTEALDTDAYKKFRLNLGREDDPKTRALFGRLTEIQLVQTEVVGLKVLQELGCRTAADVATLSVQNLFGWTGIGPTKAVRIRTFLADLGANPWEGVDFFQAYAMVRADLPRPPQKRRRSRR